MKWKKAPTWDEIGWHNFFTLRPITIEKTVYCFAFVQRRRDTMRCDTNWIYWHPNRDDRPLTWMEESNERHKKLIQSIEMRYSHYEEPKSKVLNPNEIEEFLNK